MANAPTQYDDDRPVIPPLPRICDACASKDPMVHVPTGEALVFCPHTGSVAAFRAGAWQLFFGGSEEQFLEALGEALTLYRQMNAGGDAKH